MGRRSRSIALGTGLTATALLIPGAAAASPEDDRGSHDARGHEVTLRFDVSFSPFNLVDVGEPGLSAGDQILFHDTLLRDGRQVGDEVGSCVVVEPTPLANCTGVIRLGARDTISFAFLNAPPPEKTFAVTGGSGAYRTAAGDGALVENPDQTGRLTLDLITSVPR
jgi:hypothetical protein